MGPHEGLLLVFFSSFLGATRSKVLQQKRLLHLRLDPKRLLGLGKGRQVFLELYLQLSLSLQRFLGLVEDWVEGLGFLGHIAGRV